MQVSLVNERMLFCCDMQIFGWQSKAPSTTLPIFFQRRAVPNSRLNMFSAVGYWPAAVRPRAVCLCL